MSVGQYSGYLDTTGAKHLFFLLGKFPNAREGTLNLVYVL